MNSKTLSVLLFIIEAIMFVLLFMLFALPYTFVMKLGLIWFVLLLLNGHYHITGNLVWDEMEIMAKTAFTIILICGLITYPSVKLVLMFSLLIIILSCLSVFINRTLRILFRNKIARKTLVFGTNYDAYRIGKIAHNNRFAITDVVGYVEVPGEEVCSELKYSKKYVVYKYEDFNNIFKQQHVDQIIVSVSDDSKEVLDEISKKILGKAKYVKFAPSLNFTMSYDSQVVDFDGILMVSTAREQKHYIGKIAKRVLDILAGIAGCLVLIPLTLFVRHKNHKNGDYEPIFFAQERIGLNGKPVKIYKYRSMVPDAERVLEELMESDPEIKEEYLKNKKLVNDPRITEAGEFLRRTSLDEFPQFINVLKGEMSFVGPRPYLPREKEDMDVYYNSIIKCKPGITGMWQANGRSDVGFEERCRLDDYYYKNWKFSLDLIIIFKTIKGVLYGKGAI